MSNWTHRTMIVPAALVTTCRALANAIPGGTGMWTTPLSATGEAPASHYISAGMVQEQFAALMDSPGNLSGVTGITLAQAQAILGACSVSDWPAGDVMAAMGLSICTRIDINSASRTALEAAPDIGPVRAQQIIDGRPWASVAEMCAALSLPATLEHWYQ